MRRLFLLAVALCACDDSAVPDEPVDASEVIDIADSVPDGAPEDLDAAPDVAPDMAEPDAFVPEPDAFEPAPDAAPEPDAAEPDMTPPCDPTPETCNGEDDDCDELVDEGFRVGSSCFAGVGACRSAAMYECADGVAVCPAMAGDPGVEACDGLDNDCDGRVDEDYDGDGDGAPRCDVDPCGDGCPVEDPEICRALCDAQDCRDENLGVFPAAPDLCGDGIDQNCDGVDASCSVATGRISVLSIAMAMEPSCPDVNGDGEPDHAMAFIGGLANEALGMSVMDGSLNVFLAAAGLAAPGTDGAFDLSVLFANATEDGGFELDPTAIDEDGDPLVRFPGARVREAALRAGPGRFSLSLPLGDVALELVLYDALVRGTLAVDEMDGLSLQDGLLWGAVTDVDLQATLDGILANCEEQDPAPEFCDLLAQFRPLLGNLLTLDQDLDGDGEPEAYSICLQIAAEPAVLRGWPAE